MRLNAASPRKLDGFDALHFGNVVADQALYPALQGDGGGGAAGARSMHRQVQVPVLVALIGDVAAVLGDRRANASFYQFLDLIMISASSGFSSNSIRQRPGFPLRCRGRTAGRR